MGLNMLLKDGVLVALTVQPAPEPPLPLERTDSGLIYATDFADLDGWTNGGGWSVSEAPSLVNFGRFPLPLFGPGVDGGAEDDGVREPQLYVEGGTWYLLYDAGDGVTGWRQFVATSTDQGLTWTRQGAVDADLDDGSGGSYDAVATGWLEKRAGVYYLHRVTAEDTFAAPNGGLPASPYEWDTWSADSPLGPWTFESKQTPVPGSWASINYLPNCVIERSGTFYAFVQGKTTVGPSRVGMATGPSATGPWTLVTPPLWGTSFFGARTPENLKVFWHPELARWVALINIIDGTNQFTDRNAALLSTNLIDWSDAVLDYTQSNAPADDTTSRAVGVATHLTGPDGELIEDEGYVPVVFDSEPQRYTPGWHLGRTIVGATLEPCPTRAAFSNAAAVSKNLTRALAHGDFEAEFVVKFSSGSSTNIGLWFRQDGSGNGYRLVVRSRQRLLLQKVVGGVLSTVFNVTAGVILLNDGTSGRVRIRAVGTSIKAWLDGDLQVNVTDAAHSTGTHIALSGFAATGDVRRLSIRTSSVVTVEGLTPAASVVLRSYGGLPVAVDAADGSGVAVLDVTHGPHKALEIDGVEHVPDDGIWPGDTYELP